MKRNPGPRPPVRVPSGFTGFRFPPEVILLAVRWYLRYGLSFRDLEELLAERGIEVDHVTLYRRVQRFTPMLIGTVALSVDIITVQEIFRLAVAPSVQVAVLSD